MKPVETPKAEEQFYVIGIGLPEQARHRIQQVFPHSILQPADTEGPDETRQLCDLLGRVVIFIYLPFMMRRIWVRTSAIFHCDLVKVIGVSPECSDALYDRALEAEFAGVLCDDVDAATYHRAAISVQRGELWFSRAYLSHRTRAAAFSNSTSELSKREAEILPLLAAGFTNQLIADSLYISRDTVRWHLRSIYAKLGVSNRDAALRLATNKIASAARNSASTRHTLQLLTLPRRG